MGVEHRIVATHSVDQRVRKRPLAKNDAALDDIVALQVGYIKPISPVVLSRVQGRER
jgi:hypothetical protein